jgi:septal ring factor EnvC (AmiA/AmiB activator)
MREPSAWALQVQLEKEEQRVAELKSENRRLKDYVAQLEAERYARRPTIQAQRLTASMTARGPADLQQQLAEQGYPFLPGVVIATTTPATAPPAADAEPAPPPTRWSQLEVD